MLKIILLQVPPTVSRLEVQRMITPTTEFSQSVEGGVCLHGKEILSESLYSLH